MSIYTKLAQARVELQNRKVRKTGNNTFSKYTYFELGDFLPYVNEIFAGLKLCGVVTYTNEMAKLTIYDGEGDGEIEFTSPMAGAQLKGCHEVQNLGAVETYQRRYLYMTALEISEHDILDENTGNKQLQTIQTGKAEAKVDPKVVLKGYREAVAKAGTVQQIDKYKEMIRSKLKNYPDELEEAMKLYNNKLTELSQPNNGE